MASLCPLVGKPLTVQHQVINVCNDSSCLFDHVSLREPCPKPFGPKQTVTLIEFPYGPVVFNKIVGKPLSGISVQLFRMYSEILGFKPEIKLDRQIEFRRYDEENNTFEGGRYGQVHIHLSNVGILISSQSISSKLSSGLPSSAVSIQVGF
jgi:hypothetical protein